MEVDVVLLRTSGDVTEHDLERLAIDINVAAVAGRHKQVLKGARPIGKLTHAWVEGDELRACISVEAADEIMRRRRLAEDLARKHAPTHSELKEVLEEIYK